MIGRFQSAQRTIQENILYTRLVLIPYKKGSRDFIPGVHLTIVDEHINYQLRDVRKALG